MAARADGLVLRSRSGRLVAEAESLSMAALMALEKLNPVERAVLLLRDVFDLDYAAIADVVDKSPANCRQIARRAREKAGDPARTSPRRLDRESEILARYLEKVSQGDVEGVASVFAEDVVLWSDGGGKARAARHPLFGATRVARHLVGVAPQAPAGTEVRMARVNGDPAVIGSPERGGDRGRVVPGRRRSRDRGHTPCSTPTSWNI
ncbi:MAG: sigma factor-like helix-turn-helix DNA-binding protein [Actinomycetota bacterium]